MKVGQKAVLMVVKMDGTKVAWTVDWMEHQMAEKMAAGLAGQMVRQMVDLSGREWAVLWAGLRAPP